MPMRFLALPVICVFLCAGCGSPKEQNVERQAKAVETIEAHVVALQMTRWPKTVRSQGSLYADEQSVVGAKVAGRVAEVHGDVGDAVKAGDPLVTLDQEDFLLEVQQAEAQLLQARSSVGLRAGDPIEKLDPENAPPVRQERALWKETQSSLERIASLQKQNAMSQGEYDLAAAAERVAEARYASAVNGVREKIALIELRQVELAVARERLKDAVIPAPLDGFVLNRQVAPGTYLSVGQAVAVVVRTHPLRFRGTVPERYAQSVQVGQAIQLQIESVAEPRKAHVTRVSPALDQRSRALSFEALIDNEDQSLRAGLFAEAEVVIQPDAEALVVPESAITEFAGAVKAWKVVDGMSVEQEVRIGTRREQGLEIVQGLEIGDVILRDAAEGRVAKVNPILDPALADSSITAPLGAN